MERFDAIRVTVSKTLEREACLVTQTCSWRGGSERRSPESDLCFQGGGDGACDRAMRCQSRSAGRMLVHTRKNGAGMDRPNGSSRRD